MPTQQAPKTQSQSYPNAETIKKTGGYAINCVENMEMNDPRGGGMIFSTDDVIADDSQPAKVVTSQEEEKKEETPKTMMIVTTEEPAAEKKAAPVMTSSKVVGTNNPAHSRMPVEQRHYIIA
jgi:hypothetical protein